MPANKVVYGGKTLVDLTGDTVTAAKMLSGTVAHDKSGAPITGTIATKTASDMTVSGATVTAPAGYYASAQSKSVATATQATPSISVDSAGKITASATQTAGYVSAGTESATKQLTAQAAQTITPGTADKAIPSGRYLTGDQTIKGDANLVPENIASGVSIFGVTGTLEAGSDGGFSGDTITVVNNTGKHLVIGPTFFVDGDSYNIHVPNYMGSIMVLFAETDEAIASKKLHTTWGDTGERTTTTNIFMGDVGFNGDPDCEAHPLCMPMLIAFDASFNVIVPVAGETVILTLID